MRNACVAVASLQIRLVMLVPKLVHEAKSFKESTSRQQRILVQDKKHCEKPCPSTTQVHQLLASTTVMSPMWLMESFTPSNCRRNSAVCHVGDSNTNLGA